MDDVIDLRSDTVTQPSPEMREAIAAAPVGDDQFGEDPTINRLQDRIASLMGKEAALWLPSLGARVIVPGHGVFCDNQEVLRQLRYIETTWECTAKHIEKGHSLDETLTDPKYPRYSELGFEKLHPWNIKVIYQQLLKNR